MRKKPILLVSLLVALGVAAYLLLVTPARFVQCLSAPWRYFFREERDARRARLPAAVEGNAVRLLAGGHAALPALLDQIDRAGESIRWQVMLFDPDEAGKELAGALARAARRGVRVQLSFNIDQTVNGTVADRFSAEKKARNQEAMRAMLRTLREAGVEVRDNPAGIDFPLRQVSPRARAVAETIRQNACVSANHYDHRKLLVFDERVAVVGGMNVGSNYLYHLAPDLSMDMVEEARQRREQALPEAWEKWLDVAFVIEGPAVAEIVDEFNWKWEVLGGQPLPAGRAEPIPGGVPVQFLRQYPGLPQVSNRFFDLVAGAQREIYVASPFVSYDPALAALGEASRRGVRVIFVYPHKRQQMAVSGAVFRQSAAALVDAGVELYFNDLRMAHTKLMVVDGEQVLFGSLNLNYRSFRHDLEVAAVVENEALARQVIERIFDPYLQVSYRVQSLPETPWNPLYWLIKPFT